MMVPTSNRRFVQGQVTILSDAQNGPFSAISINNMILTFYVDYTDNLRQLGIKKDIGLQNNRIMAAANRAAA